MKSLKKLLALAVVFALLVGTTPVMAATVFSDVAEADQEVVSVLTQLDIIQGYNEDGEWLFKGDQTITRAEFAAVVDRMLGMEDVAKAQAPTIFTDVPETHWASGYITTAVNQGIIVGMGDGTFDPEAPVTYEQAVKMLVCALGYEPMAAEEGGYPTGYLFVAQTTGLLDAVAGRVGEDASRSIVARLSYNALDVPLMQKITFGTSSKQYGIFDGSEFYPRKTLLSEYLNIVKLSGVVVENENTTDNVLREGLVTIEIEDNFDTKYADSFEKYGIGQRTDFNVGETNAKDFIGHRVIVFVKHETNRSIDPTIISIFEDYNVNKKLSISLEDLKDAEIRNNNVLVEYYTDRNYGRTSKIYIPVDNTLKAYINGITQQGYTGEDFVANLAIYADSYGNIEFVSTSSSGTADYDTIFINVYENFVVDSVIESAYMIYATDDSPASIFSLSYDPDDKDVKVSIVDEKGNPVDPSELKQWDVLSIKRSDPFGNGIGREIYECTLNRNSVEGRISQITHGERTKYYIDGKAYEIDPNAEELLSLSLDDQGIFYLDALGRIVAFDMTESAKSNYALFIGSSELEFSGIRVKLYTAEGDMIIRDLAPRVRTIDNGQIKTIDQDKVDLSLKAGEICTYRLNSSGEISSLIFSPDEYVADEGKFIETDKAAQRSNIIVTNVKDAHYAELIAEYTEQKRIKVNGRSIDLADDAKIIVAHASAGNWAQTPNNNFRILNLNNVNENQDIGNPDKYKSDIKISVFDVNDRYEAKLVFINGDFIPTSSATGVALVKGKSTAINEEGAEVQKFVIVSNTDDPVIDKQGSTQYKEFTLAEDADVGYVEDVAQGSIVMPQSRNSLNEVEKLAVLTEPDANGKFELTEAIDDLINKSANKDLEFYFGKVTDKKASTIYFNDEISGEDDFPRTIGNTTKVMIYDERRPTTSRVYEGTIAEVQFDNKKNIIARDVDEYYIFIRVYKGRIEDVVLYIYAD